MGKVPKERSQIAKPDPYTKTPASTEDGFAKNTSEGEGADGAGDVISPINTAGEVEDRFPGNPAGSSEDGGYTNVDPYKLP